MNIPERIKWSAIDVDGRKHGFVQRPIMTDRGYWIVRDTEKLLLGDGIAGACVATSLRTENGYVPERERPVVSGWDPNPPVYSGRTSEQIAKDKMTQSYFDK